MNEGDFCLSCFDKVGRGIEAITPLGTGLMHFFSKPVNQHDVQSNIQKP